MKKNNITFKLPTIQTLAIVLFIFVLILDGLIIYAQTLIKTAKPPVAPAIVNQTPSIPAGWRIYRDDNYGFTFHYPQESGRLEANDINLAAEGFAPAWRLVASLSRNNKPVFQVSTSPKENEGMIRNDLSSAQVEEVRVDNQKGERFITAKPDGSSLYLILVKQGDWIYSFNGSGEQFDAILVTFRFLK